MLKYLKNKIKKETYLKRIKKKQKSIIYLKLEFCSIKYSMLKKDQLDFRKTREKKNVSTRFLNVMNF